MTAARQTPPTTCNPVELWNALTPADQAHLGALAIATELAIQGSQFNIDATREETTAIDITVDEANAELTDFITEKLPQAFAPNGAPLRPDLNAIGIRQCTVCGCTEHHACEPPCHWTTPTLCSACTPPEAA
jgi:hypothetical protein